MNSWNTPEDVRLGPNAQPLAMLTPLPLGIPLVYSGREAASRKKLRVFDKDTIQWGSYPRQQCYTTLPQLKKSSPALRNGAACATFRLLPTRPNGSAFERATADNTSRVLAVVNLTGQLQQFTRPDWPTTANSKLPYAG